MNETSCKMGIQQNKRHNGDQGGDTVDEVPRWGLGWGLRESGGEMGTKRNVWQDVDWDRN